MNDTKPTTPNDIAEPVKVTMEFITLWPVVSPKVSQIHSDKTDKKGSKAPKADKNADKKVIQGTMAIRVEYTIPEAKRFTLSLPIMPIPCLITEK